MSDFEVLYLFNETVALTWTATFAVLSIVAGFLFVGLFFGQMLTKTMTILIVALYSFVNLAAIFQIHRMFLTFQAFALRIRQQTVEGADLAWHPINSTPEVMLSMVPVFAPTILVIAYIASLIFFFNTRKLDPKSFA